MSEPKVPGVYIREIKGVRSLEAVGTSTVAFIGFTKRRPMRSDPNDPDAPKALLPAGEPWLVTSWSQFVRDFGYDNDDDEKEPKGPFVKGFMLPQAVYGYYQNGGGICYIISLATVADSAPKSADASAKATPPQVQLPGLGLMVRSLSNQVYQIAVSEPDANGQFILSIKDSDGKTLESFPGLNPAGDIKVLMNTVNQGGQKLVLVTDPLRSAERKVQVGTFPMAQIVQKAGMLEVKDEALVGNRDKNLGLAGLEKDDINLICMPDLMSPLLGLKNDEIRRYQQLLINHCELPKDRMRMVLLDPPRDLTPQAAAEWRDTFGSKPHAALYYPWLQVNNPLAQGSESRTMLFPPSGYVAGLIARVDRERGVHKAPANEELSAVVGLERRLIDEDQEGLNPKGVNCIRSFSGRGIRVWGARTLAETGSEWRYINVRRLFWMVERSVYEGTQWAVFEPNDYSLWARLRRDISIFLKRLWLQGALFGATPEEAFYVKCDQENNPPELRETGILNVEVGIAPVKPAEFVIISFKQISAVAQ